MVPFLSYVEQFKNVKVLVIGDIMLDCFQYGTVSRISPEAPVPVFKFKYEKQMLGGAGNVVANLSSIGCQCYVLGIVGQDIFGTTISKMFDQLKVSSHLLKLKGYKTIVKKRFIANLHHLLREDYEEQLPVIDELLPKYQKILTPAVKKVDVVLVSDYDKGLLTPVTTQMIIEICKKFNKPIVIDPKGHDYSKYRGATLVKPNLKEFSEATNHSYIPSSPSFLKEVKLGAKELFKTYDIQNLIITLSEHGMLHINAQQVDKPILIPTVAKEVFDVSGAGDTSLALLGASLGAGANIQEAMILANVASGIVVGKLGTATVTISELKQALQQASAFQSKGSQNNKILTLPEAEKVVLKLKEKGKKIGFTNGCFDCCHLGHLHSLIEAKKHCDILIVAVNSDASIKRYKGADRPIQDEKTRSFLIACLEFVDYVLVFDDDTALPIVQVLRPDIIAKEGYPLDKWPEGQFVQSYGGKALTLKRLEGHSTSNLVKKMKEVLS